MSELLMKDEVFAIVGAAMEVHSVLGHGFLEAVYQEAMEMEMSDRGIPFVAQAQITIEYKGRPLQKRYIADILGYGQVIVELKSAAALTEIDEAQLLNYLRATSHRVGLLINFGSTGKLEWKRMVW